MRRMLLATFLILATLLLPVGTTNLDYTIQAYSPQGREAFNCTDLSFSSTGDIPINNALFSIDNNRCTALWLNGFEAGDVIKFTLNTSGEMVDVLMMNNGVYSGYLNEQPYHENPLSGSPLMESNPSFENLSGIIDYHWTVPSTESWIFVLDNMRHLMDGGRGAGGGSSAVVTVSIESDSEAWMWTPVRTVMQVEAGSHAVVNDEPLVFDEGDVVTLRGEPLFGEPDVYMMTSNQKEIYTSGSPGEWHIEATELTSLTSSEQVDWMVPVEFAGEGIYIIVDAQSTPSGGGDGSQNAALTVSLLVNPVIAPVITITSPNSNSVLLGDEVHFDASSTPNGWNQISSYNWIIDDNDAQSSAIASAQWNAPGAYIVNLTVTRIDGQQYSELITVNVADINPPNVNLLGVTENALIEQGETITVTCSCDDNHVLDTVSWFWDDVLQNEGGSIQLSRNIDTNSLGSHNLRVLITDPSGNSAEAEVNVTVVDATDPVVTSVIWPEDNHHAGTMLSFSLSALDTENPNIGIRWDFDLNFDEDGDGDKRNDWVAGTFDTARITATAEHTYDSEGVYSTMVQVVNSEGRKVELTHTVTVDAPPPPEAPKWLFGVGVVMVIGLLGLGGFFAWTQIQMRMASLEAEGRMLSVEEREELERKRVIENLYGDTQQDSISTIAATPNASESGGWGRPASTQQSYEEIAGMGVTTPHRSVGGDIGHEILDALVDTPSSEPEVIEHDDLAFLKDMKSSEVTPQTKQDSVVKKTGLAIDIPSLSESPTVRPKKGLKIDLPQQNATGPSDAPSDDLDI